MNDKRGLRKTDYYPADNDCELSLDPRVNLLKTLLPTKFLFKVLCIRFLLGML